MTDARRSIPAWLRRILLYVVVVFWLRVALGLYAQGAWPLAVVVLLILALVAYKLGWVLAPRRAEAPQRDRYRPPSAQQRDPYRHSPASPEESGMNAAGRLLIVTLALLLLGGAAWYGYRLYR